MKRYRLKIFRADGSLYWTSHAESINDLLNWLAEEMTREYWDKTYTSQIVELDPQNNEIPLEQE